MVQYSPLSITLPGNEQPVGTYHVNSADQHKYHNATIYIADPDEIRPRPFNGPTNELPPDTLKTWKSQNKSNSAERK